MKTDRELLELAAKAAGIEGEWCDCEDHADGILLDDMRCLVWNPLTDDGDRYRLARACNLIIDFDGGEVRWYANGELNPRGFRWMPGGSVDLEARAIVRAAAAIGEAMP